MNGNGAKESRIENVLRFLGLASGQRRGTQEKHAVPSAPPSENELRDLALARLLRQDADGCTVLLQLIEARSVEALASAHDYVGTHAICTGYLGAQAALARLHEDLIKLRG